MLLTSGTPFSPISVAPDNACRRASLGLATLALMLNVDVQDDVYKDVYY